MLSLLNPFLVILDPLFKRLSRHNCVSFQYIFSMHLFQHLFKYAQTEQLNYHLSPPIDYRCCNKSEGVVCSTRAHSAGTNQKNTSSSPQPAAFRDVREKFSLRSLTFTTLVHSFLIHRPSSKPCTTSKHPPPKGSR